MAFAKDACRRLYTPDIQYIYNIQACRDRAGFFVSDNGDNVVNFGGGHARVKLFMIQDWPGFFTMNDAVNTEVREYS